jgi:hypothetical protein
VVAGLQPRFLQAGALRNAGSIDAAESEARGVARGGLRRRPLLRRTAGITGRSGHFGN